ncbi:FUSC family protein [Alicyclobacillus fodiniaquatilis]|uniref:FUSC family protein n=1 Tax=Alicyclobacillus fodiniaquatilis TaxID=1661150 RepID=A0ABW4JD32_9BACL
MDSKFAKEKLSAKDNAGFRFIKDALRWSNETPINYAQVGAGLIGMAGCISLGFYLDNLVFGLLSTFGVMITSGTSSDGTIKKQTTQLLSTTLVGTVAMVVGSMIVGHGWITGVLIVMISTLAALMGGISRPVAIASTQFMLLTMIGTNMGDAGLHQGILKLPAAFAIGSLIGVIVLLAMESLLWLTTDHKNSFQPTTISNRQRFLRWRRSLTHFIGWQYAIRVGLCMLAAQVIEIIFHFERSYWIGLTIAIVLQRDLSASQGRIVQRGIGTAAGVVLGTLVLLCALPQWSIVVIVGVLGALRPIFKNRSYAIYAMLMTPLMLMMFSAGRTVTASLLEYRLLDTMIGCMLAYALGCYVWRK